MAIKNTTELLATDDVQFYGGPFYLFSTRTSATDLNETQFYGGLLYTPHVLPSGAPPVTYNTTQFFALF